MPPPGLGTGSEAGTRGTQRGEEVFVNPIIGEVGPLLPDDQLISASRL